MTPYRYIQLAYAISMLLLLAACFYWYWPLWVLWLPTGVFLVLTLYGSCFINSGMHLKALCRGSKKERKIAITFDDGPHPSVTPQILDILRENDIKATFFCIGTQMERFPAMLKLIAAEGHIVGNHSWAHGFWFDLQSAHNMRVEINKTSQLLQELVGVAPRYFRPPYGVTNPNLAKAVKATQMVPVGWSLRSFDTVVAQRGFLGRVFAQRLKPGDIVLFHDTQAGTVSVLKEFLRYCNAQGYQVVPLNELINIPPYE